MLVVAYLAGDGQNTDAFICRTRELHVPLGKPHVQDGAEGKFSTDRISMLTGKCYS